MRGSKSWSSIASETGFGIANGEQGSEECTKHKDPLARTCLTLIWNGMQRSSFKPFVRNNDLLRWGDCGSGTGLLLDALCSLSLQRGGWLDRDAGWRLISLRCSAGGPFRGGAILHSMLIWTTYQLIVLTFFLTSLIFDATLFCLLFVNKLRRFHTEWPSATSAHGLGHLLPPYQAEDAPRGVPAPCMCLDKIGVTSQPFSDNGRGLISLS